jgi:hypothetical protein
MSCSDHDHCLELQAREKAWAPKRERLARIGRDFEVNDRDTAIPRVERDAIPSVEQRVTVLEQRVASLERHLMR